MRELRSGDVTVYLSDDLWSERVAIHSIDGYVTGEDALSGLIVRNIREWVLSKLDGMQELVNEVVSHSRASKSRVKYGILNAHGTFDFETMKWMYSDDGLRLGVEDWIADHEARHTCLVLCTCNPAAMLPKPKRALLFVPDKSFTLSGLGADEDGNPSNVDADAVMTLVHPKIGVIDQYTYEYELDQLREGWAKAARRRQR